MNTKKSVLIIIDMQNEFCLNKDENIKDCYSSIIKNINLLSSKFRKSEQQVLWLNWGVDSGLSGMSKYQKEKFNNFEYSESMNWKKKKNLSKKVLELGSWSSSIIKQLNVEKSDLRIHKQRMSGFWYTDLEKTLKRKNLKHLYFAGINTDQCVIASLQDAHFIDFDCYLVSDCTATSSPKSYYEASINNINNYLGTVLSSEEMSF